MEGIFAFQNGLDLTIKTALNTKITASNSLKQLTVTARGLTFGRAYYRKNICVRFGAYFQEGLFLEGLIIGIFGISSWGSIMKKKCKKCWAFHRDRKSDCNNEVAVLTG